MTKLRSDLVLSRQETAEGAFFVVKDPVNRRFFRFGEAEQFIVRQLDGSTPLETVRRKVEEKFGEPLDSKTLEQFVDHLRNCAFLEADEPARGVAPCGRIANPLYLRMKTFDPDRLLNRIIPYFGFCFTPQFVAFSALLLFTAIGVCIVNWQEVHRDISHLYRFDALLLAWLTAVAVTVIHEFAHALTCKKFGGEVHEMGFLLIYFQPAFYCNVSDAWMFPSKSQRLWVTFAGAYLEIVIWAAATLLWRVVEPGTWLSFLALVVMATSGIKTLFNLNPLIKLDGYYLLGDYLEIPNLRTKSFRYLADAFRRLAGAPAPSGKPASPRERRIHVAYGWLAGIYSFSLLSLIIVQFGGYLVWRYQGVGFFAFTLFLMTIFQNPIRRTLRRRAGPSGPEAAARPLFSRRLKLLAALAVALGILFLGRMELKISAEFKLLPAQSADVRATVEGIVADIWVEEGATVHQGDPIASLSDRDLASELQKIEALIAEKKANLKMLKIGARPVDVELVQNAVETATTRKQYAQDRFEEAKRIQAEGLSKAKVSVAKLDQQVEYSGKRLESSKALFSQGLIARSEVDRAEEEIAVRGRQREEAEAELKMGMADNLAEHRRALAVAGTELEEANSRLKVLLAGSRPEEKEAVQAEIANLEAQERHIQEQLNQVRVMSPISGIVTTHKPKEMIGQHVNRGDLIVNVHELSTVTAEILSPEKEISDLRIGQPVVLKARAYPQETFYGKVTSIAPVATKDTEGFGERIILVTCQIENHNLLLKSEMTGKAKIYCGQRRIVDVLTQRLARYLRVEFWSWW